MDGVKEGDFTMVLGFRRTDEYLPSIAVKQIMEKFRIRRKLQ